jgi:hypothetical protein
MSEATADEWLASEAEELLEMGPVGLYEFLWSLTGSPFALTAAEAREAARRVASGLVRDGVAELRTVTWPTSEVASDPLPVSALEDDGSWTEGRQFVALVPAERF